MKTIEQQVEELSRLIYDPEAPIMTPDTCRQALQERDRIAREGERERIWTKVSMKKPTLLANYPRGKQDNYNTGRIDGWNICKSFIRDLTQPPHE
jgi:hypothetical protein